MGQPYLRHSDDPLGIQPKVRIQTSVDLPIITATRTVVIWNTEIFDASDMFNPLSATKISFPTAGTYLVGLSIKWQTSSTGTRIISIEDSASVTIGTNTIIANAGINEIHQVVTLSEFEAGDYIQAFVTHTHGSNRDIKKQADTSFWAFRIN